MEFSPPPRITIPTAKKVSTARLPMVIPLLILLVLLIAIGYHRKSVVERNRQWTGERIAGAPAPITTVLPTNTLSKSSVTTAPVVVISSERPESSAQKSSLIEKTVADSRPHSGPQKVLPTTKVKGEADCKDPNFPHYDPKTSTCVECLESSFHCLTGFQRCYQGRCVVKNSPQCSFYPIGGTGGAIQV